MAVVESTTLRADTRDQAARETIDGCDDLNLNEASGMAFRSSAIRRWASHGQRVRCSSPGHCG